MADIGNLVQRLRLKLDDPSSEMLSIEFLENEIFEAISRHTQGEYTIETLPVPEEFLVLKLALINCFRTLAIREAQRSHLKIDTIEIDRMQATQNFYMLVRQLQESYDSDMENRGGFYVVQADATRVTGYLDANKSATSLVIDTGRFNEVL